MRTKGISRINQQGAEFNKINSKEFLERQSNFTPKNKQNTR